ncbi:MAG: PilZ domain-containing protein [Candidatus Omnitrophica bacterium]|nr:PilZ domain-containing protein [Candidatus Omnitrophota bacterium]
MFKKSQENLRKHKRLIAYRLLSYEGGPVGESVFCNLNNISEGGVLFTSPERVEAASVLQLKIILPSKEFPLEAVGEVVRVEQVDDKEPHRFKVACTFKQISDENKKEISGLIEKVSSSEFAHKFIDEHKKSWRRK